MASKQNFTPEEWSQVLESIMLAGIAVSAADPNGLWGTLKEAFAGSSAMSTSKLDPASNELVKEAVADFETSQGRSVRRWSLLRFVQDAGLEGGCARGPDGHLRLGDLRSSGC